MDIGQWAPALITSATEVLSLFFGAIPRIVGFLVILVTGWLISGALAAGVTALLRAVHFNLLAQRSGFHGFLLNMGLRTDSASVLASVFKWFVRLIVLVVGFDALGLPAVSVILHQFLLWIPNLVAGIVILVIAGLAADALGNLVRGATTQAGFDNPDLLETITRVAILAFGIVVAVNQIGIARELINALFVGFVSALALAAGFAFGLGGRQAAARLVQNWYRRAQASQPRLEQAAENSEQNAEMNRETFR